MTQCSSVGSSSNAEVSWPFVLVTVSFFRQYKLTHSLFWCHTPFLSCQELFILLEYVGRLWNAFGILLYVPRVQEAVVYRNILRSRPWSQKDCFDTNAGRTNSRRTQYQADFRFQSHTSPCSLLVASYRVSLQQGFEVLPLMESLA